MKIEQQCVSLELSKRLKELGVKQESLFYYEGTAIEIGAGIGYVLHFGKQLVWEGAAHVSAFTVAELGEMLPAKIEVGKKDGFFGCWKRTSPFTSSKKWGCNYQNLDERPIHFENNDTEADARAKMLIYLLENKLIPAEGRDMVE